MKKNLFSILALILVACASPQVTVTSDVTVTLPPPTATIIPTPTLHPQFVTLQEQIAVSGERFTLNSDGTVQDGGSVVSGLKVDVNGQIKLMVDGQEVEIAATDLVFDDENGVIVNGYVRDESGKDWMLAVELTPAGQALTTADLEKVTA
jgi:hypothetical protein